MNVISPEQIPAMATAVERAIIEGKSIGPVIEPFIKTESFPDRLRPVQRFVSSLDFNIDVPVNGKRNCYMPLPDDRIVMCDPRFLPTNSWNSVWNSVLLHECQHATEWRRAWHRGIAVSELRAECGQAILEKLLHLPFCPDQTNQRKWQPQWLEEMQEYDDYVFDAVVSAVDSVEYLIDRAANPIPWTAQRRHINESVGELIQKARQQVIAE